VLRGGAAVAKRRARPPAEDRTEDRTARDADDADHTDLHGSDQYRFVFGLIRGDPRHPRPWLFCLPEAAGP
jgi:hypothetical protein